MAPAVAPAFPTAPEESDSLLWTLSGGLSPPPVLGAGAARTTSSRCEVCLRALPCPLQPASLTISPRLPAPAVVLTRFYARHSSLMIAFHGPREHLAPPPLAQLELLCIFICGSVGQSARAPAPLRSHCVWRAIGSGVRVVARVPPRHRFCACRPANTYRRRLFQVLSLISSCIRNANGGSNRRARESDPARVVL